MKNLSKLAAALLGLLAAQIPSLHAQIAIPSDGSDGDLVITTDTVIDLGLATTGVWSADNSANAGKGIYDPEKWAVVFKYKTISIATNVTVSFLNHPTHAPVIWLVQHSVLIDGAVSVSGQSGDWGYPAYLTPTEPGPGGFRGGTFGPLGEGAGYGPGGVNGGNANTAHSAAYVGSYGNPQILPLIGGSGGGGIGREGGRAGPSGGGAILIAAELVTLNGSILSDGMANWHCCDIEYTGSSGGAVKIISDQTLGVGTIRAERTRVEANRISSLLNISPNTIAVPPGATPILWAPSSAPVVEILSVDSKLTPFDPRAGLQTSSDLSIGTNGPVSIRVQTKNFPPSGSVQVRVTPKYGYIYSVTVTNVSGDFSSALWEASTTFPNGFSALQAHATSP